jgi:8-oxo-dGTP pyrophosphatase MutT (NUDIX family)
MMDTVYLGTTQVHFVHTKGSLPKGNDVMYVETRDLHTLKELIQAVEKSPFVHTITVGSPDPEDAFTKFSSCFRLIEAAGGLVLNPSQEALLIYRLGKWDLPKGKTESGEGTEESALREVREECGISILKITQKLPVTYHTYKLKGEPVLKRTHWFEMYTDEKKPPVPQQEEDITEACWMGPAKVKEAIGNTYPAIKTLLQKHYLNR